MQIRAKVFNPQIFLELICYVSYAVLMIYLLSSGRYLSYVTPRMKPYLIFSAVVIGIWAMVTLGRLLRPQHKIRSMHCFVLALPILLLLLPHRSLGTADISGSYIGGNILSGQASPYGSTPQRQNPPANSESNAAGPMPAEAPAERNTEPASDPFSAVDSELLPEDEAPTDSLDSAILDTPNYAYDFSNLPGLDSINKTITVSNEDFGLWISELYVNMEKYEGYTVSITGFVFKDSKELGENAFVPMRLMMSCCVADLMPVGLLCKYDKASQLENDSWVTVEGTLFIGEYTYDDTSFDEPQINVTKITPAQAVEGYVYLY